jgi:hypothetical protein
MLTCRADTEYDFSVLADGDSLELLADENMYGHILDTPSWTHEKAIESALAGVSSLY